MIELIDEKHGRVRYTPRQDRVAYPLTRDDSAIPQNPISDQQTRQHFLDLSCFAEIWWRRHGASGNNGVPVSTTAEKPPWRPIWPSRELEFDRENLNPDWHAGQSEQACLVCATPMEEPYTMCDECGLTFTKLFQQRYGIDLGPTKPELPESA
jgi:hypothetical protein